MNEDFEVPIEFENYYNEKFRKDTVTEREFVDLCLLALKLLDDNWDNRFGFAYKITHVWFTYRNIEKDELLDTIGQEIGTLEIPDNIHYSGENEVRAKWKEIEKLVKEADKKFS